MAKYHMKRCSSQLGFSGGSDGKESACNVGSVGSICGLGRSPGKGNGNRLQCSCLGNSMNRGGWRAIVHGVAKSQTWLSDQHFHFISVIREIQKRHVKKRSTSLIVQFSSVASDSATPWTATHQASLSITNSRSLLKPLSIESVMPSSHLILTLLTLA